MSKTLEVGQKLYMAHLSTTGVIVMIEAIIEKVGKVRLDHRSDMGRGFVYLPQHLQPEGWLYNLKGARSEWQFTTKHALTVLRDKAVEEERKASASLAHARQVILACDKSEKAL